MYQLETLYEKHAKVLATDAAGRYITAKEDAYFELLQQLQRAQKAGQLAGHHPYVVFREADGSLLPVDLTLFKIQQITSGEVSMVGPNGEKATRPLPQIVTILDPGYTTPPNPKAIHAAIHDWYDNPPPLDRKPEGAKAAAPVTGTKEPETSAAEKAHNEAIFKACTRDLTHAARAGELPEVVGRDQEIKDALRAFNEKNRNSVLLSGMHGIGKSSIALGIAQRIAKGKVHPTLKNKRVIAIDAERLIKTPGNMAEKMQAILDHAKDSGDVLLVMDDFAELSGHAKPTTFKHTLASGQTPVIGTVTYAQLGKIEDALKRKMHVVQLEEMKTEDAIPIVRLQTKDFAAKHRLSAISDELVEDAVRLSARYVKSDCLPQKAIDLLSIATSHAEMEHRTKLVRDDLLWGIEKMTGNKVISDAEMQQKLKSLEPELRKEVVGQDHAVSAVAQAIRNAKAGLKKPNQPIGTFVFAGKTGVGKTELANALGRALDMPVTKFDMADFDTAHKFDNFNGSPVGYVGHDQGGQLTNALLRNPRQIILLDEIEKADKAGFQKFLGAFDSGQLKDSHGRTVDCSDAIFIMTSNMGVDQLDQLPEGASLHEMREALRPAYNHFFSPEMRGRLGSNNPIVFNRIERESMNSIVDKFIGRLSEQVKNDKGYTLVWDQAARDWLATHGHKPASGARGLEDVMRDQVHKPLANLYTSGGIQRGDIVRIKGGPLGIEVEPPRQGANLSPIMPLAEPEVAAAMAKSAKPTGRAITPRGKIEPAPKPVKGAKPTIALGG